MDYYLAQLKDIAESSDLKLKISGEPTSTKWLTITTDQAAFILNYLSEQNK